MNKCIRLSKMWFLGLLLVTFAAGCGGNNTVDLNAVKAISAYSLDGVAGTINETAKTIAVTVPFGKNVTAMVATFTTTGASVKVGTVVQTSGTTANDFTNPVTYTVTAVDSTTASYTVSVTIAPNTAKAISAYSFVGFTGAAGIINEPAKTIAVTVPYGTSLANLIATFTTTGTGVKVGATVQTSGTTANDFTTPGAYTVIAADGTTATYTVNVTVAPNPAKAITAYSFVGFTGFSGTLNEPAKTIAVNLPFGTDVTNLIATFTTTGTSVKVGTTDQTSTATANNFTGPVAYTVTAADGSSAKYTVNVTVAPNPAKAITAYSFAGFTGAAGTINESAKTITLTVPYGTKLTNLIATFTTTGTGVNVGTEVQTSTATANNFTGPVAYIVTAADGTSTTYTVNVTVAPNPAKTITAYSFVGFTGFAGTINEPAKAIAVTVPYGTDVTNLIATFTTTGTVVNVGTTIQTSTASANNFTGPVAYIVTAADGTSATYNITVTVAEVSDKEITAYSFAGFTGAAGTINEEEKAIAVTVPKGTDVTNLLATYTTTGVSVMVGTTIQTSVATPNNFTSPVIYTVTAADGSSELYTVTVTESATAGPAPVNLGTAGNFVILAKSGVSTTGTTAVVGDIGISPAAASFITGFALIADSTNTFSTSSLVTGKLYASDYAQPTPAVMTTAVSDMQTAFTDAAGRPLPDFTELGAGDISGLTLVPGLYKWGTGVLVTNAGVTLSGGANDVWIFQIAQDLTVNNSAIITLSGGAQAKNIFWQVAGQATLGTAADFKGIILSQTLISLNAGAKMNGRALAQTAVTLNATAITAPAP
jgi:Ice-binding-like